MQNSENKTIIITLQKVKTNAFEYCPWGYGNLGIYRGWLFPVITAGIIRTWVLFKGGFYMRKYGTPYIFISSDSDYPTIETTQPKIPTLNLHSRRSLYDLLCIPREGIIARYNEKKQN